MARAAYWASLTLIGVSALVSSLAAASGKDETPPEPAAAAAAPATATPAATEAAKPADSATATEGNSATAAAATTTTQSSEASTQSADKKTNKVALSDDTITEAQLQRILAKGYKPEGRAHEVRYCRRETIMGSHFEQKACRTALQILSEERNSQEMTDRAQRTHPSITGN